MMISDIFTLYGVINKNPTAWATSESLSMIAPLNSKPSGTNPPATAISVPTPPGLIS